jgi:hypothetical protein
VITQAPFFSNATVEPGVGVSTEEKVEKNQVCILCIGSTEAEGCAKTKHESSLRHLTVFYDLTRGTGRLQDRHRRMYLPCGSVAEGQVSTTEVFNLCWIYIPTDVDVHGRRCNELVERLIQVRPRKAGQFGRVPMCCDGPGGPGTHEFHTTPLSQPGAVIEETVGIALQRGFLLIDPCRRETTILYSGISEDFSQKGEPGFELIATVPWSEGAIHGVKVQVQDLKGAGRCSVSGQGSPV